jgi:hypothetical protein
MKMHLAEKPEEAEGVQSARTVTMSKLRVIIHEAAASASSLPSTIGLYEEGSEWHHVIVLIDSKKLDDGIDEALVGGITLERLSSGGWGVGSVAAQHGNGPLLYRLAMEFANEEGGVGLKKNPGGNISPSAGSVWKKFDDMSDDPSSKITKKFVDYEDYFSTQTGELSNLRARKIELNDEQAEQAVGLVRNLWTAKDDE